MRKRLTLLLAALMVCTLSFAAFTGCGDGGGGSGPLSGGLRVGQTVTVNRDREFTINCNVSGWYTFYSIGGTAMVDPYGVLLDSQRRVIFEHDDLSLGNYNFSITAWLEAGRTYYLRCYEYDDIWYWGSYQVSVRVFNDLMFGDYDDFEVFYFNNHAEYVWAWDGDLLDEIEDILIFDLEFNFYYEDLNSDDILDWLEYYYDIDWRVEATYLVVYDCWYDAELYYVDGLGNALVWFYEY
jgi:hypothetical protein